MCLGLYGVPFRAPDAAWERPDPAAAAPLSCSERLVRARTAAAAVAASAGGAAKSLARRMEIMLPIPAALASCAARSWLSAVMAGIICLPSPSKR